MISQVYKTQELTWFFIAISLDKADTIKLEEMYAKAEILVVSNNSANRWQDDVPMLIPEINASHLDIIKHKGVDLELKKDLS